MAPLRISGVTAREVLDCLGRPTLQVDVWIDECFLGRADVPSGRSTGRHEATELRDGGTRFGGFGVRTAVGHVRTEIAQALIGQLAAPQRVVDQQLLDLDGTPNKSRLGANALLGVSLAVARAAAAALGLPLYRYLNADAHVLPVPQMNLINGGGLAPNDLDFQEIIIMPAGAATFMEAMEIAVSVTATLRDILVRRYGKGAVTVGDDGGFGPPISKVEEGLSLLHEAVEAAGQTGKVVYGLDCAATHLYDAETLLYQVGGRGRTREDLLTLYERLVAEYGVVSIEDPLHEDDFEGFAELARRTDIQIVGDDLFVTNAERLRRGIEAGAANALLWKVNQIGTLSEALDAAMVAMRHGYSVVVSERAGETEDAIIADLVVALNAGQIKTGGPMRGERTAKYNALLRIAEELGPSAVYAGWQYRSPS